MILRLVTYDIEEDKYRNKLAKKLEAFGFERIQKSVFCGTHTLTQWRRCWVAIQLLHRRYGIPDDKVYVLVIGKKMLRSMQYLGLEPDKKKILNEILTLWV